MRGWGLGRGGYDCGIRGVRGVGGVGGGDRELELGLAGLAGLSVDKIGDGAVEHPLAEVCGPHVRLRQDVLGLLEPLEHLSVHRAYGVVILVDVVPPRAVAPTVAPTTVAVAAAALTLATAAVALATLAAAAVAHATAAVALATAIPATTVAFVVLGAAAHLGERRGRRGA